MNDKIKVLITGDDGYIANKFAKYVSNDDRFEITLISVIDDKWKEDDFSKYDTMIHLAGIVHRTDVAEDVYDKVNYKLTIELAEKVKKEKVNQFMFFSTASVYGDIKGKIDKNTKENPNNFYGESKLKAEKELKNIESEDFKICILRPPMVYGKGCKGNYCSLAKLAKKLPIFPKINNKRSMIYIDNLCEFMKLLILNDDSGIYYPQNSNLVNTSEMVKLISKYNNKKIFITRILSPFVSLGKKVPGKIGKLCNKAFGDLYYDMEMSQYKQDYNVKSFEDSIKETEE